MHKINKFEKKKNLNLTNTSIIIIMVIFLILCSHIIYYNYVIIYTKMYNIIYYKCYRGVRKCVFESLLLF